MCHFICECSNSFTCVYICFHMHGQHLRLLNTNSLIPQKCAALSVNAQDTLSYASIPFICFPMHSYALIRLYTLLQAFISFHTLSYPFIYFHMHLHAFIRFRMLSYAFIRLHLLTYAFICLHSLICALICFHALIFMLSH